MGSVVSDEASDRISIACIDVHDMESDDAYPSS